jgi:hypothetical protein
VEVVLLCAKLGMVGIGPIAFDGTKLKANASIKQTRDEKGLQEEITWIEAEIKKMMERSRQIDQAEDSLYGERDGSEMPKELINRQRRLKKLVEAKAILEAEQLEKVNICDVESRLMSGKKKVIGPCYKGQLAVDSKEQVIPQNSIYWSSYWCTSRDRNCSNPFNADTQCQQQGNKNENK